MHGPPLYIYRPQKFHRYARAHSYFVAFKALIAEIEEAKPGDDPFDARVTVLGKYVKHHVKEEQNDLFPKLRKKKLDLKALGEKLQARKAELAGE